MLIKDGVRVEIANKRVWFDLVADTVPATFWLRIVQSPCALSVSQLTLDDVRALADGLRELLAMEYDAQHTD